MALLAGQLGSLSGSEFVSDSVMEFECEADDHPVYATEPRRGFEDRWFDYKAIDQASERATDFHKHKDGGAGGRPAGGAGMVGFQTSTMVLWRCEKLVASPIPVFKD